MFDKSTASKWYSFTVDKTLFIVMAAYLQFSIVTILYFYTCPGYISKIAFLSGLEAPGLRSRFLLISVGRETAESGFSRWITIIDGRLLASVRY